MFVVEWGVLLVVMVFSYFVFVVCDVVGLCYVVVKVLCVVLWIGVIVGFVFGNVIGFGVLMGGVVCVCVYGVLGVMLV